MLFCFNTWQITGNINGCSWHINLIKKKLKICAICFQRMWYYVGRWLHYNETVWTENVVIIFLAPFSSQIWTGNFFWVIVCWTKTSTFSKKGCYGLLHKHKTSIFYEKSAGAVLDFFIEIINRRAVNYRHTVLISFNYRFFYENVCLTYLNLRRYRLQAQKQNVAICYH